MVEKRVKISVVSSKCKYYKTGDTIYTKGPLIDAENSGNVCMTALSAIYPFIFASRKGLTKDEMGFAEMVFQCPDCPDVVQFKIEIVD